MTSINVQGIWVLSALDKLISENKKDPAIVCLLFEKKQMVLQLLQNKKIDAAKYKTIVAKAYKQETGVVKLCAEEDIRKLKDPKDDKLVEAWFKEMIENTGVPFENQQKLYNYYRSQQPAQTVKPSQAAQPPAKPVEPTKINPKSEQRSQQTSTPKMQQGSALQEIASFKVLDSMLDDYEGPIERYQQLLERKKRMLDLASRKELSAEKYKTTLELFCKKLSGTDLASQYKFELEGINDFHDGNIKNWFAEIIEQTKFSLQMQTDKLATLKNSAPKKGQQAKKEDHHPGNYRSSIRQSVKAHGGGGKKGFDIGDLNSFRVFDEQMEEQVENKDNYKAILQKKKKFLDLAKKGSLNAEKYKALLIKFISQTKNQQVKESMEFELSELDEFHNNNLAEWWQDVLSNAELMLEDQESTLSDLIQGKKTKPKKGLQDDKEMMRFLNGGDDDDSDIHISDDEDLKPPPNPQPKKQAQKQPIKKEPPSVPTGSSEGGSQCAQIFSLKALDDLMTENMKNPSKFCLYFERKQAIFDMMQRGQIDAKKYKVLQEKTLASTKNDKLKECVEMDLFDLKDMCSGNVDEWFQSLINDAGFNFEDQQEMYQKLKGKGGSVPTQKVQEGQSKGIVVLKQNPNIAEVVCFTALAKLFIHSVKALDIVYYKQLCGKRQKLIELVSQNRLLAPKYRQINKAAANKTTNDFLKACIEDQAQLLSSKFKGNQQEWFQQLKNQLMPDPPTLKMPQNPQMKKINSLPAKDKAQYLAKKMAPYESLLVYNKQNNINQQNPALRQYAKVSKKQAFKAISMLAKDPEMDIYNLAQKLFPIMNAEIFYGGALPALRKKAQTSINYFVQEIAAIKDYSSKIKKATNPNNLENAKKQIAQCQSNITFLKSWPGKQLVPFPLITQEKIQRYNLDLNTHLDKNQVQISINYIQNLESECYLRIYAGTAQKERYWIKVKSGPQKNVRTIIKLTPKEAIDLMKGELPVVVVRFFEKSFWGNFNLIGEVPLKGTFIRNNIAEEKANNGRHVIHYEMRVHKPTKPLVTEIMHTTLKILPQFKVSPSIQKQLIKQCLSELK